MPHILRKKAFFTTILTLTVGLVFSFFIANAAPDNELTYHGKLTDTLGISVPNGNYDFTITIYDSVTGGTNLWSETKTLPVTSGIFSTTLGDTAALNLDFADNYWLEIQIDSNPAMTPRRKVTPTGFALNSHRLNGLTADNYIDTSATAQTKAGNFTINGNLEIDGTLNDSSGGAGSNGQILSSTASGTDWIDASTVGTTVFTGLADTPAVYSANQFVKVNAAGDGLEFGSDNDTTYSVATGSTLLSLTGTEFSFDEGALSDGALCKYIAGTGLECDTSPSDFLSTGLEELTEGSNTGWRLVGQDPDNYGNIGNKAVDLSSGTTYEYPSNVDDDFTGSDGDAPNPIIWNRTFTGTSTVDIQSNQLVLNKVTNQGTVAGVTSQYYLSGSSDFDIQIDHGDPPSFGGYFEFGIYNDIGHYNLIRVHWDGNYYLYSYNGSSSLNGSATIGPYQRIRISRVSGTTSAYYWNGSSWILIGAFSNISDDVKVDVRIRTLNTGGNAGIIDVDDYIVNAGALVWPSTYGDGATGTYSLATGYNTASRGNYSVAMGKGIFALNQGSLATGLYNIGTSTDTIHETGIGIDNDNRANAFEIYTDGRILAPELSIAEINTSNASLTTKEYVDLIAGGGVTTFTGLSDTPNTYDAGSILFTSGSAVTEDNDNFFWDDANDRLGLGTTTPSEMLDINGNINFQAAITKPGISTVAVNATAGNLNGNYRYKVTFVDADGHETNASDYSAQISPANQQVNLTNIPVSVDSRIVARRIYRNDASDISSGGPWKYLAAINDNTTTTYIDNISDGSLGATYAPAHNETSGTLFASGMIFNAGVTATFGGLNAGTNNSGQLSTGFGYNALQNNTGIYSAGFGSQALQNNTGGTVTGFGYNALQNNTGAGAIGVGYGTLQNNTGNYAIGIGYNALQNNNVNNVVGVGAFSMHSNSGQNSSALGYGALQYNAGGNSSGVGYRALYRNAGPNAAAVGYHALQHNIGTYASGMGYQVLNNNTGDHAVGFGYAALFYNEGDDNIAIGREAFNTFNQDTANAKSFAATNVNTTTNQITVTAHGFGSIGDYVNLYLTTTGVPPGNLPGGSFTYEIIDANTLQPVDGSTVRTISTQGTGTHTLTPQFVYSNSIAIGYDAEPTASNQMVLGNASLTEVIPGDDDTVALGSSTRRWEDLYLGPNSLHIGNDTNEGIMSYDIADNLFAFNEAVTVAGSIRLSNDANACSATNEGTMRYNTASQVMEFCNGTSWGGFDNGSTLPTCTDGQTLSYNEASGQWECVDAASASGGGVWTHDGSEVFSGAASTSWTDIDLSSVVGTQQTLVLLQLNPISNGASIPSITFRSGATTEDLNGMGVTTGQIWAATSNSSQVLVETDENGVVQFNSNYVPVSLSVDLVGYFDNVATTGGGESRSLVHVQDRKAVGVEGGTSITGVQTRDLNTVLTNEVAGASLDDGADEITLPAGEYYIEASAPAFQSGMHHKIYLYDTSTTTNLVEGMNGYDNGGSGITETYSMLSGKFTLSAETPVRIDHYISSGLATQGLGAAGGNSTEIYTDVKIWKIESSSTSGLPTCTDGQTLSYNEASGQWECADSVGGGWIHDDTQVHVGTAPTSWTDLDLSNAVGNAPTFVMLKIENNGSVTENFYTRTNGETATTDREGGAGSARINPNQFAYVTVETDANGLVEWYADTSASSTVNIVGYIGGGLSVGQDWSLMHVQDQKITGIQSQSRAANADTDLELNTIMTDEISGASLTSNEVTLPAGKYHIEAIGQGIYTSATGSRLSVRKSDDTTLLVGSNLDYSGIPSCNGSVTLTEETTIKLVQHSGSGAAYTTPASNSSPYEVYADLRIWKIENSSSSSSSSSGYVPGFLYGFNLSNDAGDTDHDVYVTNGYAKDETNTEDLEMTTGTTKQLDVSFTEGDDEGGLFSGTVAADSTYHVFLIAKDDGTADIGFDTDPHAANIPSGFTSYRWLGMVFTDASANVMQFTHTADDALALDDYFMIEDSIAFNGQVITLPFDVSRIGEAKFSYGRLQNGNVSSLQIYKYSDWTYQIGSGSESDLDIIYTDGAPLVNGETIYVFFDKNPFSNYSTASFGVKMVKMNRGSNSGGGTTSLWAQNGSDVYYDSGNVGIGISTPSSMLHIMGDESVIAGENRAAIGLEDVNGGEHWRIAAYGSASSEGGGNFGINESSIGTVRFLIENDTGNIGIGMSNPNSKLHVTQTNDATFGGMVITNSAATANLGMYVDSSKISHIGGANNSPDAITIDNVTGNVGLSSTSHANKMNIMGGGINMDTNNDSDWASVYEYNSGLVLSSQTQGNASYDIVVAGNQYVGIGNVTAPAYRLDLPNTASVAGRGRANQWVTYSDSRVKTHQNNISYGLEDLLKLQPRSYIHNSSELVDGEFVLGEGAETIGFIAQEVYGIIPEAVGVPEDESTTLWSLDYDRLVPLAVKAIQEQNDLIITNTNDLTTKANAKSVNELQNLVDNQFTEVATLLASTREDVKEGETLRDDVLLLRAESNIQSDILDDIDMRLAEAEGDIASVASALNTVFDGNDMSQVVQLLSIDANRLVYTDEENNLTIDGIVTAERMEAVEIAAEKFIITASEGAATSGTAMICPVDMIYNEECVVAEEGEENSDGVSVFVETAAVTERSRVMVTPREPIAVGVVSVVENEGFEVQTDSIVDESISFDWFIVDSE